MKTAFSKKSTFNLHILVDLNGVFQMFDFDSGCFKHLKRVCFVVIMFFADDALYSAVDDEHCAGAARSHFAINGSAVDGNAALCRLTNRVLFRMNCADTVLRNGTVRADHFAH